MPARAKNIAILIKNVFDPKAEGTVIQAQSKGREDSIKSISCMNNIALLKVFGEGTGYRIGVMAEISRVLSDNDVNILSAVTSQTCIALLLSSKDLNKARHLLTEMDGGFISKTEASEDVALICIVGEGLGYQRGIAYRVFSAVNSVGASVGMISAGASLVAYHFTVSKADLEKVTRAVHQEFFGC